MASWTVSGKGIEDPVEGKSFTVVLDVSASKWTASGPDVGDFFATKSGAFKIIVAPENGTRLEKTGALEVAFFKALNGTSATGATGTGRAAEKAVNFSWKLEKK